MIKLRYICAIISVTGLCRTHDVSDEAGESEYKCIYSAYLLYCTYTIVMTSKSLMKIYINVM